MQTEPRDNVSYFKSLFEAGETGDGLEQKIADFFPAIIYVYDVDQKKIRFLNKKLTDLLGYSLEDIEQWDDFMKFVFNEDVFLVQKELEKFNTLHDRDIHSYNSRFIDKQGNWKYFRTQGTILRRNEKGNPAALLFIARDITYELHKEEEAKAAKDLLNETEKLLHFGTWTWDIITDKVEWSDGLYTLLGYSENDVPLKISNGSFIQHVATSDAKDVETAMQAAFIDKTAFEKIITVITKDNQEKIVSTSDILVTKNKLNDALENIDNYFIETSIHTKKGINKRVETYGKIKRRANGMPYKIVGITRDIALLKDYKIHLQQKIEELDRSNKELEEFAYIASHDLQEPLRKITAFSERLQEKAGHKIGQEGELYLQRILAATQNMRLLIDNLLEFSRVSRHKEPLQKIDLNNVFKEALNDLELKVEETHTTIECSSLPLINAYYSQMRQLFANLLSNGIKFIKPGESPVIKISCEELSAKEKEDHLLVSNRNYYKIMISDSGIGFEQEYALRIFQIFQRLHGKAEYPGSGIGLAICKKIVDNHNGIIYAESKPGKGTVFSVILPENQ